MPHRAADVSAHPKKVNLKKDGIAGLELRNKSEVLDGRVEEAQAVEVKR